MLKSISENQYDRVTVRKYIVKYFGTRPEKFESLCFEDDDESDDNLRTIFDGLPEILGFQSKIEKLILTTIRINKYAKLLHLLKSNNPKFDIFILEITNPSYSSPPTKAHLDPSSNPATKLWAKNTQFSRGPEQSKIPPKMGEDKYGKEVGKSPRIDRMSEDIASLEEHIVMLGNMEDLLKGVRKEIAELKKKINDQRQMIHNEMMKAARESNEFQETQKVKPLTDSSVMADRQRYSTPNRGWKESQYAYKPN